jgi:hypothetical protein
VCSRNAIRLLELSGYGHVSRALGPDYWITELLGVNASFSISEDSDRLITAGAGIRF